MVIGSYLFYFIASIDVIMTTAVEYLIVLLKDPVALVKRIKQEM